MISTKFLQLKNYWWYIIFVVHHICKTINYVKVCIYFTLKKYKKKNLLFGISHHKNSYVYSKNVTVFPYS